jgi:hypothetical protein
LTPIGSNPQEIATDEDTHLDFLSNVTHPDPTPLPNPEEIAFGEDTHLDSSSDVIYPDLTPRPPKIQYSDRRGSPAKKLKSDGHSTAATSTKQRAADLIKSFLHIKYVAKGLMKSNLSESAQRLIEVFLLSMIMTLNRSHDNWSRSTRQLENVLWRSDQKNRGVKMSMQRSSKMRSVTASSRMTSAKWLCE